MAPLPERKMIKYILYVRAAIKNLLEQLR